MSLEKITSGNIFLLRPIISHSSLSLDYIDRLYSSFLLFRCYICFVTLFLKIKFLSLFKICSFLMLSCTKSSSTCFSHLFNPLFRLTTSLIIFLLAASLRTLIFFSSVSKKIFLYINLPYNFFTIHLSCL